MAQPQGAMSLCTSQTAATRTTTTGGDGRTSNRSRDGSLVRTSSDRRRLDLLRRTSAPNGSFVSSECAGDDRRRCVDPRSLPSPLSESGPDASRCSTRGEMGLDVGVGDADSASSATRLGGVRAVARVGEPSDVPPAPPPPPPPRPPAAEVPIGETLLPRWLPDAPAGGGSDRSGSGVVPDRLPAPTSLMLLTSRDSAPGAILPACAPSSDCRRGRAAAARSEGDKSFLGCCEPQGLTTGAASCCFTRGSFHTSRKASPALGTSRRQQQR
jgi:hypothetical protein